MNESIFAECENRSGLGTFRLILEFIEFINTRIQSSQM